MQLRPYQEDAVRSLIEAWQSGLTRSAMIAATGAGKTVTFAHLIARVRDTCGVERTLVLAHREELLQQAKKTIKRVAPALRVEVMRTGKQKISTDANVILASVQTVSRKKKCKTPNEYNGSRCKCCVHCTTLPAIDRIQKTGKINAIICDEAHHAAAPSYVRVFDYLGAMETGDIPLWGFTATMSREQGGLSNVWQTVAATVGVQDLVEEGYLVKPHAKQVVIPGMDLNQAKVSRGDFTAESLADMMLDSGAMSQIAVAYKEYAYDRPGLVFCPTVEIAELMTDALKMQGIRADTVWGAMSKPDREKALRRFRDGDLQVLVNVMVLTEGYDEPKASCVVIARPTKSRSLYAQMVGRVLRLSPETGKEDALILDVMGATTRHSLATLDDVTGVPEESEEERQARDRELDDDDEEDVLAKAMPMPKDVLQVAGWRDVQDLFGQEVKQNNVRWLLSPGGVRFAPFGGAHEQVICFLVPSPQAGYVRLRMMHQNQVQVPNDDRDYTLKESVDVVAQIAEQRGTTLDSPKARWRRDKNVSDKQMKYAERVVMEPLPVNPTKGSVGDLIDKWTLGLKMDAYVQSYLQGAQP